MACDRRTSDHVPNAAAPTVSTAPPSTTKVRAWLLGGMSRGVAVAASLWDEGTGAVATTGARGTAGVGSAAKRTPMSCPAARSIHRVPELRPAALAVN